MAFRKPYKIKNFKNCDFEFYAYNFIELQDLTYEEIEHQMIKDIKHANKHAFKIIYAHDGE